MWLFIEILQIAFITNLYILFIIMPIWIIYIFSIKSHYSYLNTFTTLPIVSLYKLTIVSLYRYLYIKYIWIAYNIAYKRSLYFGIPGVWGLWPDIHLRASIKKRNRKQLEKLKQVVTTKQWGQKVCNTYKKATCASVIEVVTLGWVLLRNMAVGKDKMKWLDKIVSTKRHENNT